MRPADWNLLSDDLQLTLSREALRRAAETLASHAEILAREMEEVTSVNVVEKAVGLEMATVQAALGGSCGVSLVGGGLSISPMASTPM